MGRPKGSRNREKSVPTADRSPATTKHNAAAAKSDLTEDQQRALLVKSVSSYQLALKAKNDYAAAFIKMCKQIKGDGVNIDDVKTAIKLQTPEGEAKLAAKMLAETRVARWYGSSIGTQFGLFEGEARAHTGDEAFEAGKRAGLAGKRAVVPPQYDVNEWLRGHQIGQVALAGKIKQQQKDADADAFDATPPWETGNGIEASPEGGAAA